MVGHYMPDWRDNLFDDVVFILTIEELGLDINNLSDTELEEIYVHLFEE